MDNARAVLALRTNKYHEFKLEANLKLISRQQALYDIVADFSASLRDILLRRNTHAPFNTVMFIKLQYPDRALWLIHTGVKYNSVFTVMNCIPMRYDGFRERMMYYVLPNTRDFLENLYYEEPMSAKVFLATKTTFNINRVVNIPAEITRTDDDAGVFFSHNFFTSPFFRTVITQSLTDPATEILSQGELFRAALEGNASPVAVDYQRNIMRLTRFVDVDQAFASPKTGFMEKLPGAAVIDAYTKIDIDLGSGFSLEVVKEVVANACQIMRSMNVCITAIHEDTRLCFEAMVEAGFAVYCIFGPPVVGEQQYLTSHRNASFLRFASWLTVVKMIVLYGCKTIRTFFLMKSIFAVAHNLYATMDMAYAGPWMPVDPEIFHRALFVVMFGDQAALTAHMSTVADEHCPIPTPALMHVGFYTVRQIGEFFVSNLRMFAKPFNVSLRFMGFGSMPYKKAMWDTSVDLLIPLLESTTPYAHGHWSRNFKLGEALGVAVDDASPTVTFGNTRLSVETLGDAMRRIYLTAMFPKYVDGTYRQQELKEMRSGPVGSIAAILLALRLARTGKAKKVFKKLKSMSAASVFLKHTASQSNKKITKFPYLVALTKPARGINLASNLYVNVVASEKGRVRPNVETNVVKVGLEFSDKMADVLNLDLLPRSTLQPDTASERQLLDDVLLINWFLQSPIFHRIPYDLRRTISNQAAPSKPVAVFRQESLVHYHMYQAVEVPDKSVKEAMAGMYDQLLNGLINIRQHGLVASTTTANEPDNPLRRVIRRTLVNNNVINVSVVKNSNKFKEADNVIDMSVVLSVNTKSDKLIMEFLEDVGKYIYTMTSQRRPPPFTGTSVRRLFERESLVPTGFSRTMLMTEDVSVSWSKLRVAMDGIYGGVYRTVPTKEVLLYDSSIVYTEGDANVFPLFEEFVYKRTQGGNNDYLLLKLLKAEYLTDPVRMTIGDFEVEARRTPLATFAFYEAKKLTSPSSSRVLSPLEVFRLLARLGLAGNVSRAAMRTWDSFPNGQRYDTNVGKTQDLDLSTRTNWSPNEYYGEIEGYVFRGLDTTSLLEETVRGNCFEHYASSRSMHSPEVVTSMETGLVPVFDMTAAVARDFGDTTNFKQRRWAGLGVESQTVCAQDLSRKQWALYPKHTFAVGNTIGVLGAEISPIELMVESTDIFDPGMPNDEANRTSLQIEAYNFHSAIVKHVDGCFNHTTLYPVGEFEWFQHTHALKVDPILYKYSSNDPTNLVGTIHRYDGTTAAVTAETLRALGPYAYRERTKICGYHLNGARFSSRVRYVRYTNDPNIANAVFVEVSRKGLAAFGDEPMLSYWALTAIKPIANSMEIVVMVPSDSIEGRVNWRKLLLSGYNNDGRTYTEFGYAWGLPIKVVSNYREFSGNASSKVSYLHMHSPLPITNPRLLTVGAEWTLLASLAVASDAMNSTALPSYEADAVLDHPVPQSDLLANMTVEAHVDSLEVVPFRKVGGAFPADIIRRNSTMASTLDGDFSSGAIFMTPSTLPSPSAFPGATEFELAPFNDFIDFEPFSLPLF